MNEQRTPAQMAFIVDDVKALAHRVADLATDIAALRDTVAAQAEQIRTLMGKFNTWVPPSVSSIEDHENRIQALESPASAPEPDVLCECGHVANEHPALGSCWHKSGCDCRKFTIAQADPETAHQEPPDAVLVAIRELYVLLGERERSLMAQLREAWRERTGVYSGDRGDTERAIRSYGRDGAR